MHYTWLWICFQHDADDKCGLLFWRIWGIIGLNPQIFWEFMMIDVAKYKTELLTLKAEYEGRIAKISDHLHHP